MIDVQSVLSQLRDPKGVRMEKKSVEDVVWVYDCGYTVGKHPAVAALSLKRLGEALLLEIEENKLLKAAIIVLEKAVNQKGEHNEQE